MSGQHHIRARLVSEDSELGSNDTDSRGYSSNQSSENASNYTYDNNVARNLGVRGQYTDRDSDTDRRRTSGTSDYINPNWLTPHEGNRGSPKNSPNKGLDGHKARGQQYTRTPRQQGSEVDDSPYNDINSTSGFSPSAHSSTYGMGHQKKHYLTPLADDPYPYHTPVQVGPITHLVLSS